MKPWKTEFPVDKADDMDDAARRILLANIRAGKSPEARIRAELKRFQETGELPDAWEVEPEEETCMCCGARAKAGVCSISPDHDAYEFDRRVDEINRELEAIESGCVEPPKLGWLCEIGKPR